MEGLLLLWIVAIIVATMVGSRKGRGPTGFVFGLLLAWLGVLFIALMPKTQLKLQDEAQARLEAEQAARQRLGAQ